MRNRIGEETARHMIKGMRSIASNLPISPFHLAAADDMESLLNEVLEYRKLKKKWVGLTDEEIMASLPSALSEPPLKLPPGWRQFADALDAKLKEKNT